MKIHYCQNCYTKNPESAHICSDCGRVIESTDIVTKERHMREFLDFFLEYPIVREDGQASQRREIEFNAQKWIITYDMWAARVEWWWFVFFTLFMVLPGIKYLHGRRSHLILVISFNDLGFPTKIQDRDNHYQHRSILELYMDYSSEYRRYVDKNPNSITRKPYTKKQLVLIAIGMLILSIIVLPATIWYIAYLRFHGVI